MATHTTHAVFTIVADVIKGKEHLLKTALERFAPDRTFAGLENLHFSSFVVFPGARLQRKHEKDEPPSKLILECVIDGPIRPFLKALVRQCTLNPIFANCEGYNPAAEPDETFSFLWEHRRMPQLYHVGTPYQSASSIQADRDLRDRLENRLHASSAEPLAAQVERAPAGEREYWRWEIIKPWLAWPAGILGVALAWWLWRKTQWIHWTPDRLWVLMNPIPALVELALAAGAILLAFRLWITAVPELRDRVTSWLRWAVGRQPDAHPADSRAGGSIDSLWRALVDRPVDRTSFRSRLKKVLTLLALAAALVLIALGIQYVIAEQVSRNLIIGSMAAILLARAVWLTIGGFRPDGLWVENSRGVATFLAFAVFVGSVAGWVLTRISWWVDVGLAAAMVLALVCALDHLWNWRWWIAGYFVMYLPTSWAIDAHPHRLVAAITLLFFLKAWWLTVLVGWPAAGPFLGWKAKPALFIAGAAGIGFTIAYSLIKMPHRASIVSLLILGALFALWGIPLPSPDVHPRRRPRNELNELRFQEDLDVQNHMAALVPLKEEWFRAPVLRSFLWLLNAVFFRGWWLRDWYKGKLFGLSTVHFCQWVLLDNRNYIFLSNYDHSWTTYLDDFGQTIGTGIQKIWGQGEDNPGTSSLERFKQFARSTMVTHSGWYRAYPGLTVRQIWNNEQIRRGAQSAADEETIVRLLRRFGAAPKTLAEFTHAGLR